MTTPATPHRPDEEPLEAARSLIDAMLDGHLSDSGVRRLETLVREREDVQRLYVRSVHLRCSIVRHAGPAFVATEGEEDDVAAGGLTDTMILPAILSAGAADFDEPAPIKLPPMPVRPAEGDERPFLSRAWVRWSTAAVAAVIVVGLMTAVWFASRPAPKAPIASAKSSVAPILPLVVTPATAPVVVAAPPPRTPVVCTVAGQVNAKWDESPLAVGDEMVAGRICSLGIGLAQLHFVGGADVIVEGPAAFTVGSAGELALRSGKVVATVPGGGFVVRTPEAAITDLGTEFGVNVERDGATGVHVFKGRVQAAPAPTTQPTSNTPPPPQVLAAGESAAVARHAIERREADRGLEFVRSDEMAARVKAAGGAAYDRWRAFGYEIRRDPALLAYYTFERDAARPSVLANTAPAAGSVGDGTIEGAQWADGRFASKTALHFGGGNDRVKVNLPGRLRSVTLWAWVKVEPLAKGQRKVALLLSDNWQKPGVVHWNVFDTGAVDLGMFPFGGQQLIRTGQAGAVPIPSGGGWVFVACTCDVDGTVRVYRDGEPVGPPVAGQPAEFEIGPAQIGNWDRHYFNSNTVRDDRHFHGSFDELGVLSRAASDAEMKRIYDAGRP